MVMIVALSPCGWSVTVTTLSASGSGQVEVLAGYRELDAVLLDVDAQAAADPGIDLDLGRPGRPRAHPFRQRRRVEPLVIDHFGRS
jgi:hypothetical protein